MRCPPEIASIISGILSAGLLRIRAFGWNENAERCAVEADHLHNLPALLTEYRPELLDYYWRAERVSLMQRFSHDDLAEFEPFWHALAEFVVNEAVAP